MKKEMFPIVRDYLALVAKADRAKSVTARLKYRARAEATIATMTAEAMRQLSKASKGA